MAHGDTNAELDVSKIIINSSLTDSRPLIVEASADSISAVAKFTRTSGSAAEKAPLVANGNYTLSPMAGMGSGLWCTFSATGASDLNMGGMFGIVKSFTDGDNYVSKFSFKTLDRVSGSNAIAAVLELDQDEVIFQNTDVVKCEAPFQTQSLTTTERDALTAANGMVIYNETNNRFEFYQNGGWVYYTATAA